MDEKKEIIICVLERDGEIEGNHYSNYVIVTCVQINGISRTVDKDHYKFKKNDIYNVTGFQKPNDLLGLELKETFFDKYGRLSRITFNK